MSDPVARLNAALEGRYAIARKGVNHENRLHNPRAARGAHTDIERSFEPPRVPRHDNT